mmetsp:Transcript_88200/g.227416  ORF Transcript_88200/g.227416 Transcript_88200/m.227416 type:complete len:326 (+) Transcript_88200:54-1031(+)
MVDAARTPSWPRALDKHPRGASARFGGLAVTAALGGAVVGCRSFLSATAIQGPRLPAASLRGAATPALTQHRAGKAAPTGVFGGAAVSGAVLASCAASARWSRRRSAAVQRSAAAPSKEKSKGKEAKEEEAARMEGELLDLFNLEQPDIYEMRSLLTKLAKLSKRPNQTITGDWIIFWASKEFAVDKVFGTGMTGGDAWWMQMQEYLLRIGSRKEGRPVEAYECVRRVGPFPNQSNRMQGTYEITGTNGLQLNFTEIQTDDEKEIDGCKEKTVNVDVIYSSKKILAMQYEGADGECDFFVCTPVADVRKMTDKLMGAERARFFFN